MYLIVGLGNPEKEYENTRHNMGFNVINKIAKDCDIKLTQSKFNGLYTIENINGEKVILLEPQTYMNLSGKSIKQFIDFYKIENDHILVIYDDMDVEVEKIKIRKKGGPGSHNGMKSVVHELITDDFPRIRVGIGRPIDEYDAIDYVIGKLEEDEYSKLEIGIEKAKEAVIEYIKNGIDSTMNKYN